MMKNTYSALVRSSVHVYQKYRITNYYEVFENDLTVERYKEIVSFIRETGIKKQ